VDEPVHLHLAYSRPFGNVGHPQPGARCQRQHIPLSRIQLLHNAVYPGSTEGRWATQQAPGERYVADPIMEGPCAWYRKPCSERDGPASAALQKPGRHGRELAQPGPLLPELGEGLLHCSLRVAGVVADAEGNGVEGWALEVEQLTQGRFVALCDPAGELTFGRCAIGRGGLPARGLVLGWKGCRAHHSDEFGSCRQVSCC
jgi:hypothetical protein